MKKPFSEREVQLIEKHIDQELTETEKIDFDDMIKTSIEYRQEANFQAELLSGLKQAGRQQRKKEMLEDFRKTYSADEKMISFYSRKNVLRLVAGLAVLIMSSLFFMDNLIKPSSDDLFEEYFFPYDGVSSTRDLGVNGPHNALMAYNDKDYAQAIILLEQQINQERNDKTILLLASAYLAQDREEDCISILLGSDLSSNQLNKENKQWYLALAYLKMGEINKSEELLDQIISSKSMYRLNAEKLLDESLFESN